MSQDHISVPKFIQKNFSNNEIVYCYNFVNNKGYFKNIRQLGTQSNYYDKDVEQKLSNQIETKFSIFYHELDRYTQLILTEEVKNQINDLMQDNKELIYNYFSFLLMRNPKAYESVKNDFNRKISHSDLVDANFYILFNPLNKKIEELTISVIINLSETKFINTFSGFFTRQAVTNSNNIYVYIPLSSKLCILIMNTDTDLTNNNLYYSENNKKTIEYINKKNVEFEKKYVEKFIYGESEELVSEYL